MLIHTDEVYIAAVGSAVPSLSVANTELVGDLDTSDEWIKENLGIHERRYLSGKESLLTLSVEAAQQALSAANLRADQIDGVIVATSTPHMRAPSMACLLQAELGIAPGGWAFDVQAVCSGFVYGCVIAASLLLSSDSKHVLVLGADAFSKITDFEDRNCVFFGDGAGAAVLSKNSAHRGLFVGAIHADGRGHEGFMVPPEQAYFQMQPKAVYEMATTVLPNAIRSVTERAGLTMDDIKFIAPHQPSVRVLNSLADSLAMEPERVLKNMSHFANTAAATVPMVLTKAQQSGLFTKGDHIVLAAVGSGWTWGVIVLEWAF